jgi:hypothetical protein
MRNRSDAHIYRIALSALVFTGLFAGQGSAQMTLAVQKYSGEAQQWATSMVIATPQDLTFRWTIDGPVPSGLHWEILKTYAAPSSVANGPWARLHHVSAPPPGQFAVFKIDKDVLPVLPSGHAFWVRLVGTVSEKTRGEQKIVASPSVQISYATSAAPTAFASDAPLWIKLTKIICEAETADGSPSDEVYAIVASVFINHDNVPLSPVLVAATRLYEGMDAGEVRPVQVPAWGPPDGTPMIIDKPENAVVLVVLMENDGNETDNMSSLGAIKEWLSGFLKSLPKTGTPDAKIIKGLQAGMAQAVIENTGGFTPWEPDDQIGTLQQLPLEAADLIKAQNGQIVKKALVFSYPGVAGRYQLRFQLGKEGLETVVW